MMILPTNNKPPMEANWIHVNENLPDKPGLYEVLFDNDTTAKTWYVRTLGGERKFMILDSLQFRHRITHWRKLNNK